MDLQLNGKKALVSASSSGIGYSIAKRLAEEGAEVIINGRTQKSVDEALGKLKTEVPNGKFLSLAADLGTAAGSAEAIKAYPTVDILVNNLGIYWAQPFAEVDDAGWEKIFEVNIFSGIRLARHYFPKMLAADWGRIIFISSESAIMVPAEMVHYGVTKSAQLSLASGLAQLSKGTGVTVNSVLPGPTQTDNVITFMKDLVEGGDSKDADQIGREFIKAHRPSSLLGRLIKPEEIGALVAFVASPLAAATNGAALRAEGGLVQSLI